MTDSTVHTQRSYVVTESSESPEYSIAHTQRSYVVIESAESPEYSITHTQRAYVVTTPLAAGGLGQAEVAERPEYIVENGTPYVKFEPNTNDKKLLFYPETDGTYTIIALRPNFLDFYESTQVFAGPAQVVAPHFNQLFMTDRTLEDAERNQIKQGMLSRATGSGIDLEYNRTSLTLVDIVNPDAETGDMTGWTASGGVVAIAEENGTPFEGNFMFYGGDATAASNAYQDIGVSVSTTDIDAGYATISVLWYQKHSSSTELARMYVEFLDEGSVSLGEAGPAPFTVAGSIWVQQSFLALVPANTRTVRLHMDFIRNAGTNLNAYIDAISANIFVSSTSENSVPGGLKDPYIPGVIGAPPPPGVATLLDSTKYTGSGNISQAHVFDPSTTLAVVVVNNVMSTSANPITPVMTINGDTATREASTYYSTAYTEGAFAFSVSNPSSGDIVYAGGAGESWMMTVYEFSNAAVGIAVDQGAYTVQSGSPISTLSAAGDYVIHAITLGRQDGDTVTSFSGGAFESHDPAGAYYTGASAIVEDASGTYSWSFTGGADSYQYRVAIPILNA